MPILTADTLYDYAKSYSKRAMETGANYNFPTFREAARKFRCKLTDIESAIHDYQGDGYLREIAGYGSFSGVAEIEKLGDYRIEVD